MQPTAYPHINQFLQTLLTEMSAILGDRLIGLYLAGSLVWGDYEDGLSDIDLLAATATDIGAREFEALDAMHLSLIARYPHWDNRLEVLYMSLEALKTFREKRSQIAVISPGEPFNIKDAGADWLMNWYMMREYGVTLYGPPPGAIIDPISLPEFVESVKDHARMWPSWIDDMVSRGAQAYAVLTLCRALYTCKNGEQVSKAKAAAWTALELPPYAAQIERALVWRREAANTNVDAPESMPETRAFVMMIAALIDRC
jgi:predicted nucleotidyltransferase